MKTIIINPWFREEYRNSKVHYEIESKPVFSFRDVDVYRLTSSWLYTFKGTAITERAGFNAEKARSIINGILDGTEPFGYIVTKHLRAHGHKAREYDEFLTTGVQS